MAKRYLLVLLFLSAVSVGYGQNKYLINGRVSITEDSISFFQIKTDSIFNSNQVISVLVLPKNTIDIFNVKFAYSDSALITTSSFATSNNAVAAINGGFFNVDEGGAVTYFEDDNIVISRNRNSQLKFGMSDSIINGAVVIKRDFDILIQSAKSQQFYEDSKEESAVLITGPLLLLNSERVKLPNMKFANVRHPRTCLALGKKSIYLVTIDGRSKKADGMNLHELQDFLLKLGCVDAINLDGGGSTTMWIKNRGIVNYPSDKKGERLVSNALLIIRKDNCQ